MPEHKLCKRLVCSPFDNCSCDEQSGKVIKARTNDDVVRQTNILAQRLAAMNGIYIKTPYYDFSKCESKMDKLYWSMACMAQELLTGTVVYSFDASLASIINTNIRLIKAFEKFEQIAEELDVSIEDIINAQSKTPPVVADGV